ncbi:MAG: hypothetical protein V4735_01445 [Pseudomonadota bacterium]
MAETKSPLPGNVKPAFEALPPVAADANKLIIGIIDGHVMANVRESLPNLAGFGIQFNGAAPVETAKTSNVAPQQVASVDSPGSGRGGAA